MLASRRLRKRLHAAKPVKVATPDKARCLLDALSASAWPDVARGACKLELHPQKTQIVYGKDANRTGTYPVQRFDFLGHSIRRRRSLNRNGNLFVSFAPAISDKAAKAIRQSMRRWKLHHRNDLALAEIARWTQPFLLGWIRYYGKFHKSALSGALRTLNSFIVRWVQRKYKRLRGHTMQAWEWLRRLQARQPTLFAHWIAEPMVGR